MLKITAILFSSLVVSCLYIASIPMQKKISSSSISGGSNYCKWFFSQWKFWATEKQERTCTTPLCILLFGNRFCRQVQRNSAQCNLIKNFSSFTPPLVLCAYAVELFELKKIHVVHAFVFVYTAAAIPSP